jgi:polynucleotide 5'-hydroxyl-kinase GRC3/NOL9
MPSPSQAQARTDARIEDIIPLVVNTMGWSKGMGADLNARIEEILEPTHIFDFRSLSHQEDCMHNQTPAYLYPSHGTSDPPEGRHRRYDIEPAISPLGSSSTNYRPADLRTLSLLSYFHAIFPSLSETSCPVPNMMVSSWDSSLPLCARPPYEVLPSVALDEVILTGPGAEDVVSTEIGRVLNGALVALVRCEPGVENDAYASESSRAGGIPYTQASFPPSPHLSTCLGLALIRALPSIHNGSGEIPMHVLTPMPISCLASCRIMVKGEQELPIWGMLDFRSHGSNGSIIGEVAGVERDEVPYLRWGPSEGAGGEKRRVRRNIMRKGQM